MATRNKPLRRQRRIPGYTRQALPSCVLLSIQRAVLRDAQRHNVSRSWVIAVILAEHYRIADQELYE